MRAAGVLPSTTAMRPVCGFRNAVLLPSVAGSPVTSKWTRSSAMGVLPLERLTHHPVANDEDARAEASEVRRAGVPAPDVAGLLAPPVAAHRAGVEHESDVRAAMLR